MRIRLISLLTASLTLAPVLAAEVATARAAPVRTVATAEDSTVSQTLRLLTETAHHPYLTWPDYPHYRDAMEGLYEPVGYGLLWFEGGMPTPQARAAVEALLGADVHALRPEDYDAGRLQELLIDIAGGREVDGSNVEERKLDLAAVVRAAIQHDQILETVARVEPKFPQYSRMQEVLVEYRDLAIRELPRLPDGVTVQPGDDYAAAGDLRALLIALGDLAADAPPVGVAYEGELVRAVGRFQTRHGLDPDGVIGKATFAELNTPIADRVGQIELAIERLRWLPDVLDAPLAVVNVPAFELWMLDPTHPDDRIALEMRVVVGKAVSKQTPAFRGDMRYVVLSPYWNVPYSIAVNEILPALKRDAGYLESHNMEIVAESGPNATVYPATEENVGQVHLPQRPGDLLPRPAGYPALCAHAPRLQPRLHPARGPEGIGGMGAPRPAGMDERADRRRDEHRPADARRPDRATAGDHLLYDGAGGRGATPLLRRHLRARQGAGSSPPDGLPVSPVIHAQGRVHCRTRPVSRWTKSAVR